MTDDRDAAVKLAMTDFNRSLPAAWDGTHHSSLERGVAYFAQETVGKSFYRILPHLEAALDAVDQHERLSVWAVGDDKGLVVFDTDGPRYRFVWQRAEKRAQLHIAIVDPERPDYPYSERIGFGDIHEMEGKSYTHGSVSHENYGQCIEAFRLLSDVLSIDLSPVEPNAVQTHDFDLHTSHKALALDGGIIGDTCREVGARMSQVITDLTMRWAAGVFDDTADALIEEDCLWQKKSLQFNDLDNNVFVIANDGVTAIVHRNSSYISSYRTYALVCDHAAQDPVLSLVGISDDADDMTRVIDDLVQGQVPTHTVAAIEMNDGTTRIAQDFDTSGVIGAMGFGLKTVHEIVIDGKRIDADYDEDFTLFEPDAEAEPIDTPRPDAPLQP